MSWNGVFMSEVQKHECLYNKYCREYRDRPLRNQCWQKIGEKFNMTPMDAEKKFRNIRTAYGRYLKKRKNNPSSGGQEFVPFAFENCEWLAFHIVHKGSYQSSSESVRQVDSGSDDESSPVTMSNIEFMNFSAGDYSAEFSPSYETKAVQNGLTSNEITSETQDSPKVKDENAKQAISYAHNDAEKRGKQTETTDIELHRSSLVTKDFYTEPTQHNSAIVPQHLKRKYNDIEDEDDLYCRSLVPRLKRLMPQAKAYVRIQMEQLLFHAEYSGQTPQIGSPFSNHIVNMTNSVQQSSFLNGCPPALEESASKRTLNAAHSDG